ncbi:acetyl-CoA carboxylase biotin carboxyl carrier protein [Acetobacter fabarum]|jgi:acetyl-CoA carboxylase biotin carboxyl carrier protein|uniref:acetyl-CoA carboxylase biotin carboxyl carrier protein n=1 Tax=Acetobacter TaxID=434 RepID=UPI000A370845|nr:MULTISPECIES: acetyl-CoA carboxylase biotin carboxyl carrier protein subunit [Acetobacter]MCH4025215.1 acetyl-CoA carboxylase biotin carboxyl carrier protein [Acetobacter fabarum]MCH4055136.1 acetyl-CoA carboxylase biotin carboxyl carrier protein [Acetobacter fabarum]MCH4128625.1 acetyl-CoA carboxylase biotin carboxyl carrier protein [Acetobacter fabarum]MCH4141870.1 acetyl-CoA carboxylase biotin carboxyl carrier protein [Acetobacter fabarum]MCI1243608.1 acetyl-CoA carboxylase biotin carbox
MSGLLVDADAIRALAEILTETGLTEIEVSEKDRRIRVARAPATVQAAAPAPVAPVAPVAAAPAVVESAAPADLSRHPGAVPSPMVGVAYLTPDPSSPPFASEGQIVTAGQTLMLIEAMKTFNQIKAPKGGTLKAILVASGDPVEFGQPLAIIE